MYTITKKYEKRKMRYFQLLKRQQKYMTCINVSRFGIFLLEFIILIISYIKESYYLFYFLSIITVIFFIYLGIKYQKIENKKRYIHALYEINDKSIKRLNGDWKTFEDTGEDFIDKNHNYSYDLDVFGKHSLFQWINVSHTYVGREKLKEFLTQKPKNEQIIYDRQSAIEELAPKLNFRQRLGAEGKIISNNKQNLTELFLWAKKRNKNITKKEIILGLRILSTVTTITSLTVIIRIMAFLLAFILDIDVFVPKIFNLIPVYIPASLIFIQCIILRIKKKERMKDLIIAEKYRNSIATYKNMIKYVEKHKFCSESITNLYNNFYNINGKCASKQIESFSQICELIANRRNILYPILNPILMMEYHLTIYLELWKEKSGDDFKKWIDAIGELEALCSIACIKYDNPTWNMPKIIKGSSKIMAKNIGHPLLGQKRVCNNINVEDPYQIILITGSNMSGKSTFLRTIGINMVLAYAGAPVCADQFCCNIMKLYTCMKISDNLGESISSFYAEILRIKNIVKASKNSENILFLLDEIFKGTNPIDRITGARILMRQLCRNGNLGFVSTHDLELSEMEKQVNSKIKNYHFSEYYIDNRINFDYKLKKGVSTTRNAIYLMKLAGIDIE
ncbi:MutS family DNA mismatch repair protein [Clostridium saccharobutylicum]|uniref:DNA mismatch repair protein MutS n=1 Tax=Clostridium saccharobutylicum TaxID=169679 RepID=A0A1S8N636_CLOSA|nr:MutS family DNA mismatch repair protein [Clostridium saccharobutylicum]OOM11907.1 DNA mismatch repair protein MutS [Clostridium saccharobutylicum]